MTNGNDATATELSAELEHQIERWRSFLRRRQAIAATDVEELEDHLREQIAGLIEAGLSQDEAFLVAVKRLGALDALSREFSREHSDRLWKQLVLTGLPLEERTGVAKSAVVAVTLACLAALAIKLPALFGVSLDANFEFYARNFGLFVLPFLAVFFFWRRSSTGGTLSAARAWLVAGGFLGATLFANLYAFQSPSHTEVLLVLHLPVALWLLIGIAYAGSRWKTVEGRMDFIRFSGELFIYYVLIALGGGVLTGFLLMIFETIGTDVEWFVGNWLVPCGVVGAVLIASWLVEAKQSVVENMAPVLTRLFTPLFAALMVVFLIAVGINGGGIDIDRNLLIAFDLLLAVVLGLLLYSISARDHSQPPGWFDWVTVALLVSALLANGVALWAIAARITEFGFSPNKVAALGENLVLFVNLAWSTVLYLRFLRGRTAFAALERWQMLYLPVYAAWAAIVVVAFPPLFGLK